MKAIKLIILCLIISQHFSQNSTFMVDGNLFIETSWNGLTQPLHWDSDDFKTLGYVVLSAGAFYLLDNKINSAVQNNKSNFFDSIESIGDKFGKPAAGTLLALSLFTTGIITEDQWIRETATLLSSTLLVSGLYQSFSKASVGRARPRAGQDNHTFKPFNDSSGYHSFPSGHTTVSMSIALVMGHQVKQSWLKYTFYSLGGITMWSRLYSNAHWSSDVFLGAALTYFSFKTNLSFLKEKKSGSKTALLLLPSTNGLSLSYQF